MYSNKKSVKLLRNILVNESSANIDYKYGPYASKQVAWNYLYDEEFMVVGLTVGVLNSDGSITEYWFKDACNTIDDLVEKNAGIEITGNDFTTEDATA